VHPGSQWYGGQRRYLSAHQVRQVFTDTHLRTLKEKQSDLNNLVTVRSLPSNNLLVTWTPRYALCQTVYDLAHAVPSWLLPAPVAACDCSFIENNIFTRMSADIIFCRSMTNVGWFRLRATQLQCGM
jgi:hypothetical protein